MVVEELTYELGLAFSALALLLLWWWLWLLSYSMCVSVCGLNFLILHLEV